MSFDAKGRRFVENVFLAIETGGTKLQFTAGRPDGEVLSHRRLAIKPNLGFQGILDQIDEHTPNIIKQLELKGLSVRKIGIGFGGVVDSTRGIVLGSEQIKDWDGYPLKQCLEDKLNIETQVFNDSNAAAWGEYYIGAGKGAGTLFYTNIGSGIGGGLVRDGILCSDVGALEFGQTYVPDLRRPGVPGTTVERLCSGWALQKRLMDDSIPSGSLILDMCGGNRQSITMEMFNAAVHMNDLYAVSVLEEISRCFSVGLANIVNLFAPQIIVVGGGVSQIGQPLIERLNHYTQQFAYTRSFGQCKIVPSALGEMVVPIGTLLLLGL